MKVYIHKNQSVIAIRLILLLFTLTYAVSTLAAESSKPRLITEQQMTQPTAQHSLWLAKGQAYVPPKDRVYPC